MNTETTTAAVKTAKPRKLKRYIVTLDGKPCRLRAYDRKIIGWQLIKKKGTLVVAGELPPEVFPGKKSAAKAVMSALKLRQFYRPDIVEVAPAHRELVAPGEFKVVEHASP